VIADGGSHTAADELKWNSAGRVGIGVLDNVDPFAKPHAIRSAFGS
jgi:hypothetical protein